MAQGFVNVSSGTRNQIRWTLFIPQRGHSLVRTAQDATSTGQVQEESDNLLSRIRRGRCFIDGGNTQHQVKLEMDCRCSM